MPVAEEVVDATQTAHGYLVSQLSEHISETPEGFLIVVGCPVARTGFQEYQVSNLPQDSAQELGIDLSNPHASIDLYRPADEVFAPEFLASLNGKPIVDGHPPGFVTPENFQEYAHGHIQNIRKGPQMEDGEWPVIGDLVISGAQLINKVRNKTARDISLGYDFAIRKEGKKILQCDMRANHAAIVPSGRAGDLISIGDAAPEPTKSPPQSVELSTIIAPSANPQGAATSLTSTAIQPKKENKPVANVLKNLRGRMLKAFAVDAEPEDVAEAAEVLNQPPAEAEDRKPKGKDAKSKDGESPDEPEEDDEADVEDRKPRGRDRKPAKDAHRQRMHDALDDLLDKEDDGESAEATDADLEELKNLLGQFFSEEETEPQHEAADLEPDTAELDEVLEGEPVTDGTIEEEQLPEEVQDVEPAVEEEDPDGEEDLAPVGDKGKAKDRARAADGAAAVLKTLRKSVAHCGDADVQRAFNAALGSVTRASKAGTGSHAAFSGAARARDGAPSTPAARVRAMDQAGPDRVSKLQAAYATAHKGGK